MYMNHAKQQFDEAIAYNSGNTYFELDHEAQQRLCALHNLSLPGISRPDWLESISLQDSDQIAAYMIGGDMLAIGELIATKLELYHRNRVEEIQDSYEPDYKGSHIDDLIDRAKAVGL